MCVCAYSRRLICSRTLLLFVVVVFFPLLLSVLSICSRLSHQFCEYFYNAIASFVCQWFSFILLENHTSMHQCRPKKSQNMSRNERKPDPMMINLWRKNHVLIDGIAFIILFSFVMSWFVFLILCTQKNVCVSLCSANRCNRRDHLQLISPVHRGNYESNIYFENEWIMEIS